MSKILDKISQLQFEISCLQLDEETLTGVNTRCDELKELVMNQSLLLEASVKSLDDYLNAGSKESRAKASKNAKQVYQEFYAKEYQNRNERRKQL